MFTLRFDMRAPEWGKASAADLYQAAIEMGRYAEENGAMALMVSEHHHSSDGYLPSPLVLATALASVTKRLPIQVGALLLPLHDPVRIAEDMVILDQISRGRASHIVAVGYRPEEYSMLGRDFAARGKRMDECLEVLKRCFTGEPFDYQGRRVWLRPKPFTPGGPTLFMGGHSKAAIRRAARFGLGMLTEGGTGLEAFYREECAKAGTTPGAWFDSPPGSVSSAFVAENPDAAWKEYGPYLLHDAMMYGEWMGADHDAITKSTAKDVETLRREAGNYRIFSIPEAVEHVKKNGMLAIQPLCGGLPPELAWKSLRLVVEKVIPATKR
jgi:alkanesulfonate monooxygenase SsuD/methylene tetrahydromethanopterin reductase-like flavin-dependent oxidoreductase (luciferase family)